MSQDVEVRVFSTAPFPRVGHASVRPFGFSGLRRRGLRCEETGCPPPVPASLACVDMTRRVLSAVLVWWLAMVPPCHPKAPSSSATVATVFARHIEAAEMKATESAFGEGSRRTDHTSQGTVQQAPRQRMPQALRPQPVADAGVSGRVKRFDGIEQDKSEPAATADACHVCSGGLNRGFWSEEKCPYVAEP